MVDSDTRRAARIAALVAVPVAVVTGFVAFRIMSPDEPGEPNSTAASAKPVPSTPVEMAAPQLADRPAAVCRALLSKLPDHFGDLARRAVTAGAEQNAAYGEPPVTVACGVAGPTPPDGAQYFQIEGPCWYQDDADGKRRWSLQGREVPVLVTAPSGFLGQDLVDLAKPIKETIPEAKQVCR
jgi:Protein of unknown function (DUF3515)